MADSEVIPAGAPRWRPTALDLMVLAAVLALGLMNLAQPLAYDQAMFALGARRMAHGDVLYRDYWDPKQPGLFFFYELAGLLFGFDAPGFHALELIALVVFAVVLQATLRDRFRHRWVASLTPLLSVGWFYAVAPDWHLNQIEGLVGLPLYLSVWWSVRAAAEPHGRARRFLLAGLAGGAVLALKVLFAPLLAALWLAALVQMARGVVPRPPLAEFVKASAQLSLGAALALAPIALYFVAHRVAGLAWWTTFTYPGEALAQLHTFRVHYLLDGLRWFALTWAPLLILAALGLRSASRHGVDALTGALGLWLAVGFLTLMIQALSYWQYQYLLLSVPAGLLAARGLDVLWPTLVRARPARTAFARVAVLLGVFAIPLAYAGVKTGALARHDFALAPASRAAYQAAVSADDCYGRFLADTRFLRAPAALPGRIFVIDNPLVYWLSGREQAVPRNGASFIEYASAAEWARLTASLRAARPAYVLVGSAYLPMISRSTDKCAGFLDWLANDYRVVRRTREGYWFERVDAPTR